jgi:hypothetical protein
LRSIVGTLEATTQFDARFRPTSELRRHRWERIALTHRKVMRCPRLACSRDLTAITSWTAATAYLLRSHSVIEASTA